MDEMYAVIGQKGTANLLAKPGGETIPIPCEPAHGDVPAGTLMVRTNAGLWKAASASDVSANGLYAVLKDDVSTGEAGTVIAEDAPAYRTGIFIDGAVTLADAAELTDAQKVILRKKGIAFQAAAISKSDSGGGDEDEDEEAIGGLELYTYEQLCNMTIEELEAVAQMYGTTVAGEDNPVDLLDAWIWHDYTYTESDLHTLTIAEIRALAEARQYTLTGTKKADVIASFLVEQSKVTVLYYANDQGAYYSGEATHSIRVLPGTELAFVDPVQAGWEGFTAPEDMVFTNWAYVRSVASEGDFVYQKDPETGTYTLPTINEATSLYTVWDYDQE